jgi:DNA-binding MarR family transcriptional regulator/predicted GNAT family N-acyltransferase
MDALRGLGELGLGSRLKRISEFIMKETQIIYDYYSIDFDPYLFPIFKLISNKKKVTNSELQISLQYSQPAITQALHKLNNKGLITYCEDEFDGRKKNISLYVKGKKTLKKFTTIWRSIDIVIKEFMIESSCSLIEHLNLLEDKFKTTSFSNSVINIINTDTKQALEIVTYKDEYASAFYDLNIEWLKTYFYVEPYDEEVLSKPKQYIINKGGHIFYALLNNEIVGTVALMPIGNEGLFELTKMAVSPNHRGFKIGQKLMQYCIDFAKDDMQLPELVLYSNTLLENAIYIYRKYGFIEVPLETNTPYNRSDIKMVLKFE